MTLVSLKNESNDTYIVSIDYKIKKKRIQKFIWHGFRDKRSARSEVRDNNLEIYTEDRNGDFHKVDMESVTMQLSAVAPKTDLEKHLSSGYVEITDTFFVSSPRLRTLVKHYERKMEKAYGEDITVLDGLSDRVVEDSKGIEDKKKISFQTQISTDIVQQTTFRKALDELLDIQHYMIKIWRAEIANLDETEAMLGMYMREFELRASKYISYICKYAKLNLQPMSSLTLINAPIMLKLQDMRSEKKEQIASKEMEIAEEKLSFDKKCKSCKN